MVLVVLFALLGLRDNIPGAADELVSPIDILALYARPNFFLREAVGEASSLWAVV